MATKTTIRNGQVVTEKLPPTFEELHAEIKANVANQNNKVTYCYTPGERAARRESVLRLAALAGLKTKAEYYTDDEMDELNKKASAMLAKQKPAEPAITYDPTWYIPSKGYYLCSTTTEKYGVASAGVYIKSDRREIHSEIHRLIHKGTKKQDWLTLTGNTTGTILVWVVGNLTKKDVDELIKGQPSWEVLRKVYDWDLNFWGTPKFNFDKPTIIY